MLERSLNRNRHLLADLPIFKFCPPSQTFEGTLIFHGSARSARLVTTGPAHTPEECYLVLEHERIVFTGDLAFFDSPPFMALDCNCPNWLEQLGRFIQSKFETFVPGHGPVGRKADLRFQQDYIVAMQELLAGAVGEGMILEKILELPLPEPFTHWKKFIQRNQNNLRTLFDQQSAKNKKGGR
jgi:glyoxylase-like metal-dependent hydrolase (beta-lactamase superfamily II)